MATRNGGNLDSRRAIEALRNGVPNRKAVEILGCNQPGVEAAFDALLAGVADTGAQPGNSTGMLVSGGFGSGKSHLLAHLESRALSQNFVCSTVAVSKETPLYDLGKVFNSAIENARMPDRRGRLIEELGSAMDWKSGGSTGFLRWADNAASSGQLSPMFPASLLVYARVGDPELTGKIESFWSGDRIRVAEVKDGLRRIGQSKNYPFRAPRAAELPPQRLRFAVELIRSAGYRGWVVLLDELELVGSYSLLQRGRSYAELARWLGRAVNQACPGLVAAGTVTDDFASAIISPDGKKDRDYVSPKLAGGRYANVVAHAETGMRLLERECIPLNAPTEDDVNATIETLRRMYGETYGWEAPRLEARAGGGGIQARMRYKVRASINTWDLLRFYPESRPDIVGGEYRPAYEEDADLERESRDDAEGFR